jgi:hypothetical protein
LRGFHLDRIKQKINLIENDRVPRWLELPQLENDVIADGEHSRVAAPLVQAVVGVQLAQLTRAQQLHQRPLFWILQESEASKESFLVLANTEKTKLWLNFFSCLQKKGIRCLQPNFQEIIGEYLNNYLEEYNFCKLTHFHSKPLFAVLSRSR